MRNASRHAVEAQEVTIRDKCPVVVGIGASAGGQPALEQLFTAVPSDCGISYVVVMHLPPEGPSFLAEMLQRYTTMKVMTAEEGMPLLPDTVHVIPAGREVVVNGGLLRIGDTEEAHNIYHPIDRLFRSMAAEHKERAVAVVLSGFGTDGTEGVKAVSDEGGMVIVQEPGSAISPSMPSSAIATGVVDLILPAEEIPRKIVEIARGTCSLPSRACLTTTFDEELQTIFGIVKGKTGHDFSSYKRNTIIRRIERRMAVNDVGGLRKYAALLQENPHETHALAQDILIGVTSFFRDPEAFATIRREVLPRLFADCDPGSPVRIWHACCASGEEVYSMAFMIKEYLAEHRLDAKVQLFATDIDEAAIAQARAGIYPDDIEAEVGEERLQTFFTRSDGRWQVVKPIREMIVFAHHSLLKNPPFSRLDLLVCRNFLIYLNPDMQKRLMSLFHQVLKPGGFLFLGSSETVGRNSDLFTPLDKKWKIFQRLETGRRADALFPFATPSRNLPTAARPTRQSEAQEPGAGSIADKRLMERYAPPCVVVNEKYEVVHIPTRTNRFLEVPVGEPTRDILKMAKEELRPSLRAAIYKAFTEQKQVVFRGVKVALSEDQATVNVLVEPVSAPAPAEKLVLVVFEPALSPAPQPASAGAEEALPADESSKEMLIHQLEEQLRITHEQLQATTEQLETSNAGFLSANEELISMNEEYQSANEELQSTNEELETSKEELQALNEELVTVNSELQVKVEELNQTNNDMENLLTSSEIATLFLDRHLIINRFTPAAAAIFNLIPADIGRPFRHLAGTIDWQGLTRDAETVLESLTQVEREVTALEDGRHFLMRVLPYWTTEGKIEGIVVTLIDITERKRAEQALQRSEALMRSVLEQMPSGVTVRDALTGTLILSNTRSEEILGTLASSTDDFARYRGCYHDGDLYRNEDWPLSRSIATGEVVQAEEVTCNRGNGSSITLSISSAPVRDRQGVIVAGVGVFDDITDRKEAEEALRESESRVRRKLDSILSPEGDLGDLDLGDIIDAHSMQSLMDNFNKFTHIPMAMLDSKGKVLVGVGWQDICTKFHRVHPGSCKNCIESDTLLSAGVPGGEYKLYKCKNNMWDVATPIMVGDRHFGNFFMGQFFFEDEPLDYELFRSQAKQYGFDEKEYIAALERVPRLNRELLDAGMAYFMELADITSKMGYSNLKLARSLAERDTLMESLRSSEEQFRQLAEALRHAHDELEERVQERTEELREKDRMLLLQNRLAAMGEMIGNIAHQWRQPLNRLGLMIQQLPLLHEAGRLNKALLDTTVDQAMQVVFHMSQTIDDFRNFFNPDKEKVEFQVNMMVARAVAFVEDSFRERRIVVEVDTTGEPRINGYPNEYSQVILNILLNARDAFEERAKDNPLIQIRSFEEDGRAVVTITDNAGGISMGVMPKIFDPYFTTKDQDKGTGVGLFMSKTIIEKSMAGRLTAHNTVDGAEFRIEV